MSNWKKWKPLIGKYSVHPELQEQAANKVERYIQELKVKINKGYKPSRPDELLVEVDKIMNQYDRRENANVK